MEKLFDIIKIILPSIITGLLTFLITKYNYYKNTPLDKLEVAYNRLYYPLYRLIRGNNDIDLVISRSRQYLDKYNKYADRATIAALNTLVDSNTDVKKNAAYKKFKDNIYDRHSYLRRRLGYLEPNFFQMYKYMTSSQQLLIRLAFEFLAMYTFFLLAILGSKILYDFAILAISVIILIIIFEVACWFWRGLWYLLRLLYYKIRK